MLTDGHCPTTHFAKRVHAKRSRFLGRRESNRDKENMNILMGKQGPGEAEEDSLPAEEATCHVKREDRPFSGKDRVNRVGTGKGNRPGIDGQCARACLSRPCTQGVGGQTVSGGVAGGWGRGLAPVTNQNLETVPLGPRAQLRPANAGPGRGGFLVGLAQWRISTVFATD